MLRMDCAMMMMKMMKMILISNLNPNNKKEVSVFNVDGDSRQSLSINLSIVR